MIDFSRIGPTEAIELPMEEFEGWLDYQDRDPPPPSAYPLGSNSGRCGFLEAYIWRGEAALFESVNHAWNSLSERRALKCLYIGIYAGTGGSGKWALAKMLRKALRESLDYDGRPPWGQQFVDIHEFHEAATEFLNADYAHYLRTVQKYADILNGEPGRHEPIRMGKLIQGPWRKVQSSQTDRVELTFERQQDAFTAYRSFEAVSTPDQ